MRIVEVAVLWQVVREPGFDGHALACAALVVVCDHVATGVHRSHSHQIPGRKRDVNAVAHAQGEKSRRIFEKVIARTPGFA